MDTCKNKVKEQREAARAVVAVLSCYILTTSPHGQTNVSTPVLQPAC